MKNQKKFQLIIWMTVIISMTIGGLLAIYFIGKNTGEYEYGLLLAIVGGAIFAFIVFLLLSVRRQKHTGNIPDTDERSVMIMQRYFSIALYVILFGSSALVLGLYAAGIKMVETSMIIVYMMVIFMVTGLGTLAAKRL